MAHLCWLLTWFEAISDLKINLDKSTLFLVGMKDDPEELVAEIGCKVGSELRLFGLTAGCLFKSVVARDGMEERLRRRLAMLKRLYISKGGRITLIWSTLASLSIYFMSPSLSLDWLELGLNRFKGVLWEGGALEQ